MNKILSAEPWVKRWERGLKIQKAVDYTRCVSDRFENFFGKGIFNWLYLRKRV